MLLVLRPRLLVIFVLAGFLLAGSGVRASFEQERVAPAQPRTPQLKITDEVIFEEATKAAVVKPTGSGTSQPVRSLVGARLSEEVAKRISDSYFGEGQWPFMRDLINRESGFINQYNRGGSGACGIPQANKCSKLRLGINTPLEEQVVWMCIYVQHRYGNPQGAINFHNAHNYY